MADENAALASIAGALDHPDREDLAALCLSGGGIRSASFSLGVLQGLARFGLLGRFHYLSTVSGGGYIGSWLSVWRSNEDDERVFAGLTSLRTTGFEPPQIRGIEANSNYVTPQLGLLSVDTWTVVAVYVRNLLLKWLLFLPLLIGCLLFPNWYASALAWARSSGTAGAAYWLGTGCVLLIVALSCGVCGRLRRQNLWLTQARFLRLVLSPIVLSAFCFTFASAHGGIHAALGWPIVDERRELSLGAMAGAFIYGFAWLFGRTAGRRWDVKIIVPDLIAWILSGALVGLLIALGLQSLDYYNVPSATILGLSGFVMVYFVGDIFYAGAASLSRRADMDRRWLARESGWLAAFAVSWAGASALALYAEAVFNVVFSRQLAQNAWTVALSIGISGLSGILTLVLGQSAQTPASKAGESQQRLPVTVATNVAAVIFAVSIGVLLSILASILAVLGHKLLSALGPEVHDIAGRVWTDPLVIVALVGFSFLSSLFVNVNEFSLHAMYRDRLVQAFLSSARAPAQRMPDPFTGFDPHDNSNLATVQPRTGKNRLFHVINTTLQVAPIRNTASQRTAQSFAMTRQYCGDPYVGYRPTAVWGGKSGGITLGTAMAISGAAASPNQGYNSSPLVGFLLMLFDLRLGWWLANPGREFFRRPGAVYAITPALKDLASATTDTSRWIYLSDGGHFDNLGLYEMVRRRCRCLVVVDAGCDPDMKFEDLGNAVRKVYIDFGVSIDFRRLELQARQNPPVAGARFALATISYPRSSSEADSPRTGWLLYVKPTYYGTTEGVQVRGYASSHPAFPHESTTDPLFSESQFEAYRALGAHIIEQICVNGSPTAAGRGPRPMALQDLREAAETMSQQLSDVVAVKSSCAAT
jgi:hypothetical protein